MDPILDKARAGQTALQRIVGAIPGFKGYYERERRRDADRLQREYLAARLDESKKSLDQAASALTRGGSLDAINDVETARKRLDKVANRIRYAERGYSAFFDAVKVEEAMLARVYQFDMGLIEDVDGIRAAAGDVAAAAEARPALKDLIGRLDALDARLSDRDAILRGIR